MSNKSWKARQPLLPVVKPSAKGGRPRVDDRAALNGIRFVLQTGVPWEDLPKELGVGSDMTCRRRLRNWQADGVWKRLHLALLKRLREHDQIDDREERPARQTSPGAGFGKLRMRFERALHTPLALLNLACAVICGRFVDPFC
ncbi:transposase (plasmid) [Ralstonia pseudosolanacearum]|uniref:Transposase n=1 Tax=Ralstonia solanacearum TaxID=305 RepID=A0AA92K732_RALSL|nr:transposase [Ralstonia pseudosolanacearum]QOK99800.1 transposase [Ralstonia pseudosolanacearum]